MSLVASTSAAAAKAANPNEYDEGLNSDTIQKYKTAADVANAAIKAIIAKAVPGAKIADLCTIGDDLIAQQTAKVYNKSKMEKGQAFPVCISVNNCVGHFSPLQEGEETLKEGDVAKIDLAVHVDGYIASVAQSIFVTAEGKPATGKLADLLTATYQASEIALRLIKAGGTNAEVTEAIQKVAATYDCKPVEGVLSHQVSRFVLDGGKVIINRADADHQVDPVTFAEGEAYCVDVVLSTGEGKTRAEDSKCTVYKRNADVTYSLKLKSARSVYGEIIRRFPALPFTVRALEDKKGRLGLTECVSHDLLQAFPVLYEKEGEFVAQIKFTALIASNGTQKVTETFLPSAQSEKSLQDETLKTLLVQSTKSKAKKVAKKEEAPKEAPAAEESK